MSRIVSRSEQEPLMRLQRPSSASSQDTAHLVNACLRHFLENSSTPVPMLDRGKVDNLRVSSAEQRDGYHKRYVELLKTVYDEHQRRISEVDHVEKHLIMAKAAALAAEEKALSTLDQQLGLPKGPCQLLHSLDESLLQQHHLLVPSNYLITSQPSVAAPQPPSTPSYLKPTFTSDQHSKVTYDQYTANKKTASPKKSSVSSVTQSTVKKTQTASSRVPKTVKAVTADDVVDTTAAEAGGFVASPSSIVFTNYIPGQTYTASLQLTNSSGASRQISITQPSTSYFSVHVGAFPTSEGSLAPGISCTYLVSFSPDSIATFDDNVKVISHEGVCLSVPLLGRRPQPQLEVSSLPAWYSHPATPSDNIITCRNTGTGSGVYTIDHKEATESHASRFTLSPTTFDLAPGGEINVKVTFYSDSTGEYTYPITIMCNNGDAMELTLIGCCELAHVGVAAIRPVTSEHEVEQWSAEGAPPTTTSDSDCPTSNSEQVLFDSVNPCQNAYQIVTIRNCCHMGLPYHWSLYRPITVPTTQPVISLHSPYSISPQSGTLTADSTTGFLVTFTPKQPGHFTDDAHLILDSNEATQVTPSVQLRLAGTCDEYDVILSPGCMAIPGSIQCGIDHCYRIKAVNNSLSIVYYQWQELCTERVHIRVESSQGYIVPDGVGHCELIIRPLVAGDIVVDLRCIILHRSQPLVMCIRATAQALGLTLDAASLNYGLIANGTAKTLQLPVRNDTEIPIKFHLSEIVPPNQQGCLVCMPCDGEVSAHDTVVCSVKCDTSHQPMGQVETHASIRTILSCITELGAQSCIQVLGEVQSPKVCLKSCELHVDDAYVNIPTEHVISLCNMTMVPAQFNWKEQVFGDGASHCSAFVIPSHGLLSPRSSCDLTVTVVWNTEGEDIPAAILCCEVDDMKEPILLSITGHVHGLSIHYSLVDSPDDQECHLDFGSANSLGVSPHPLYLKVTNDTAIPTSLVATVTHFPSGLVQDDKLAESGGSTLLGLTANLADPKSMSDKTSQSVLASQVLSKGRGCCFVVTPSELDLPAYSCHVIQVTAYSDMWGVYTDQLKCQISGLSPALIPISYGVVGCPLLFPTTATHGSTTVRFGSHPADSGLVRRTIKLKNTSPCEITVDWEVYNIVPDDKQLVDLIVAVGRPFPINAHDQSPDDNDDVIDDDDDDVINESCDLVKVMIKPHEGMVSSYPITINPKQTVIKGYSNTSLELSFTPAITETKDGCISSYILGHMSLSSEHDYYSGAVRAEGYDIDPIRINATGKSLYPRLSVQWDNDDGADDEIVFQFTADKLLSTNGEINSSYYTKCCVNLKNSTDMKLTFDLITHPPFSCSLTVAPPVTLIPNCSVQACVGYELTLDEVVKCMNKLSDPPVVANTGQLTIKYSTGVEQLLSLTARVLLPLLSVDVECLPFGARLLDQPTSQLVTVYNKSNCVSQWNLSVKCVIDNSEECSDDQPSHSGVFTVAPSSGITQPRQSTNIKVTFTPNKEMEYAAIVNIIGVLGDHVSFSVSGSGSADEATLL